MSEGGTRRCASPVCVDRGDRFEAHVNRAIDGRSRRCKDADDDERFVGMIDEADASRTVGQRDAIVEAIALITKIGLMPGIGMYVPMANLTPRTLKLNHPLLKPMR